MPTDIVELCIAACCIVGMALVRSPVLAQRDGLDRTSRAIATGMASTLMLVITNCIAYVLGTLLPLLTTQQPSTLATTAPPCAMIAAVVVTIVVTSATARIYQPLHRLLTDLMPAIMPSTLLLAAVCALLAPAENIYHAALTGIGSGFGFVLLLRLCVAAVTQLEIAAQNTASADEPPSLLQALRSRATEHALAMPLLLASLLTLLLGATFDAVW